MTMRIFLTCLIFVAAAASLSACNTLNGAGRDIQKVGETIEETF